MGGMLCRVGKHVAGEASKDAAGPRSASKHASRESPRRSKSGAHDAGLTEALLTEAWLSSITHTQDN